MVVDGAPAHLGQKVDPDTARVTVDGVPLPMRPDQVYYLLYKPVGVVSTAHDPQGRRTVVGMVPPQPRVFPVGRLDADSEGLILVTNDGDLADLVTHPRYGITKTYRVMVTGNIGNAACRKLLQGVALDDGPAAAVHVSRVGTAGSRSMVDIVMGEGRNREVRRMMTAVGHPVEQLVRTAIGPVRSPGLSAGDWRHLTVAEVRHLYRAAQPT